MNAPLRFALVPVEPTPDMQIASFDVLEVNSVGTKFKNGTEARNAVFAAMLAASPGNDLLQRIVMALENHAHILNAGGYPVASDDVYNILNELGGGHG